MNVQVINIDRQYEPLLSFIYPDYSFCDTLSQTRKFITHYDVKSKFERDALNLRYDDCVIISNRIFDEFWDEPALKEKCLEFSRTRLKNRKSKIETSSDSFVDDCVKFMFSTMSSEEEVAVTQLFESFGSSLFMNKFMTLSSTIPVPVLLSAMFTFISKILHGDSSLFYKKKSMLFADKINTNLNNALDAYVLREHDLFGLSELKLFTDLIA